MLRGLTTAPGGSSATPSFSKMAGGGNDFIVIDNRTGFITEPGPLAQRFCTRRLSVGADGLILIESSVRATFRMVYLNADGTRADFCANGTRCAARFAFLNVIAPRKMTIETDSGIVGAEIAEQNVTLLLPPPHGFRLLRPLQAESGRMINGSFLMVGVPHYVIFLRDEIWRHDVTPLGRELRHHPELAPEGANINFVRVRGRNALEVRTYERGVEEETLACGSGVVASTVTSALMGRVESPVSVRTRSGIVFSLSFRTTGEGAEKVIDQIRFTGDARLIYKASTTAETGQGFDPDWVRAPTELPPPP